LRSSDEVEILVDCERDFLTSIRSVELPPSEILYSVLHGFQHMTIRTTAPMVSNPLVKNASAVRSQDCSVCTYLGVYFGGASGSSL